MSNLYAEPAIDGMIDEAASYYDASLFEQAIPILKKLVKDLPNEKQRAWALLRLGQSYYFSREYRMMAEVLPEAEKYADSKDPAIRSYAGEGIFLLGLSFSKLNMHEGAADYFLRYLALEKGKGSPLYYEAQYELGKTYFHQKRFLESKERVREITSVNVGSKKRLYHLSQILLARIALAENNYSETERILENLNEETAQDEVLTSMLVFLQGEICFSKANWKNALHHFEEAGQGENLKDSDCAEDALYYIGLCNLYLSQEKQQEPANFKDHLDRSETIFKQLAEKFPSDRNYLALGRCYLLRSQLLKDQAALEKLEILFSDQNRFTARSTFHEGLLLRAEAASSYSEKMKFYRQITKESHAESPAHANAWYLRGINECEQGKKEAGKGKEIEAANLFEQASRSFQRAFALFYPANRKMAALSLKLEVQSLIHLGNRESYLRGLEILSALLNQYRNLLPELDDPGEIFYLQGLIAANLTKGSDSDRQTFYCIAENSLIHHIESYPKGEFLNESLRLLGILYYSNGEFKKAEEKFIKLAKGTPPSPYTGEALFWASNCLEMNHKDSPLIKYYRKRVYEQHPDSPFAPEAFFRYYDYAEYLKGNAAVIAHLEALLNGYPDSPYVLNALYLIGFNHLQGKGNSRKEKDYEGAIIAFSRIEERFNNLCARGLIGADKIPYFADIYYRGMLEKGLAYLCLAQDLKDNEKKQALKNAEESLYRICLELNDPAYPFYELALSNASLTSIQEESTFRLVKCYTMQGNDEAAEKLLVNMINKYQEAKITRGHYLSKSLFDLGKIILRREDYLVAVQHFNKAEDAAKGKVLRADDLLELWIKQSACFQGLGKNDEAMLILSRVINYDAVSAKRLKAMYLRAAIYEEQGRKELARKQLEAVAKKGGKWACKAKEKLEKSYAL